MTISSFRALFPSIPRALAAAAGVVLLAAGSPTGSLAGPSDAGRPPEPTPAARARDDKPDLVIGKSVLRKSLALKYRKATRKSCTVKEACVGGTGRRRLLEFDTQVLNQGEGDVTVGRPQDRPNLFEFSPCHGHYHMQGALDYSLSHGGTDTVSFYDPAAGTLAIRNANAADAPETALPAGPGGPSLRAVAGDWDGGGDSNAGVYDPATSTFRLLARNEAGAAETAFVFGTPGASLLPLSGDWDGDGTDTVGLYDPATGRFLLRNANAAGPADLTVTIAGSTPAFLPVAGDWDGDDIDTVGLYDPATGRVLLRDENTSGEASVTFVLAAEGGPHAPLAGDWDQDGRDTLGLFDPVTGHVRLWNASAAGAAHVSFAVAPGSRAPVAGDWDYNEGDLLLAGHKQAYCWLDNQRVSGERIAQFRNCNEQQGLTAGWADIYIRGLDCQWIDITDLAPGTYQLRLKVNTGLFVHESDYTNNTTLVKVHIPAPKKKVSEPEAYGVKVDGGAKLRVGEPVTIRWKVRNGRRMTHQQLWIVREGSDHDGDGRLDHPGETLLVDADIPAGARSYRWVPTEDFAVGRFHLLVRAQDERGLVGKDTVDARVLELEPAAGKAGFARCN